MADVTNPDYYKGFSNGAELIDITENLNANGAQAVQYIVRSTRAWGPLKGNAFDDLEKAKWFIEREIERLSKGVPVLPRTWDRWEAIPEGVRFTDSEGDEYRQIDEHQAVWVSNGVRAHSYRSCPPYTEVVE